MTPEKMADELVTYCVEYMKCNARIIGAAESQRQVEWIGWAFRKEQNKIVPHLANMKDRVAEALRNHPITASREGDNGY